VFEELREGFGEGRTRDLVWVDVEAFEEGLVEQSADGRPGFSICGAAVGCNCDSAGQ